MDTPPATANAPANEAIAKPEVQDNTNSNSELTEKDVNTGESATQTPTAPAPSPSPAPEPNKQGKDEPKKEKDEAPKGVLDFAADATAPVEPPPTNIKAPEEAYRPPTKEAEKPPDPEQKPDESKADAQKGKGDDGGELTSNDVNTATTPEPAPEAEPEKKPDEQAAAPGATTPSGDAAKTEDTHTTNTPPGGEGDTGANAPDTGELTPDDV